MEKKVKITLGTLVLLGAGIVLARLGFAILEVRQASNPSPNNSFVLGSVAELTILPYWRQRLDYQACIVSTAYLT